jgi:hypothetical protein
MANLLCDAETIREYALERLMASGEPTAAAVSRGVPWLWSRSCARAEPQQWRAGSSEQEHDNLRAASWSLDKARQRSHCG